MDPDTALENLRKLVATIEAALDAEELVDTPGLALTELVDTFYGLDQWIGKGGFLPRSWNRHRANR